MDPSQVATVILAGGKGTRLRPLTLHHSKPAISFGGRYRLIDVPISNSIHANFTQIHILAQYLSSELQHHISQTYRLGMFQSGSIDVLTPEENEKGEKIWFEGTADAVRKTLPTLFKTDAFYFLILSGDQLYHIDFGKMAAFAEEMEADITIAATPVHHSTSERFGILRVDEQSLVKEFIEKPKQGPDLHHLHLPEIFFQRIGQAVPKEPHLLSNMGIYLFKRDVLKKLLESDPRTDFGRHLLANALQKWKTASYIYNGYWEDIGTVESYYQANLLLTSKGGVDLYDEEKPIYTKQSFLPGPQIKAAAIRNSILCDGCRIDAAEIERCVIGMRSEIRKGTVLRNTLFLGHSECGESCRIEGAIIDENVHIGNNVILINSSGRQNFDGDGVFIRDGIIIVTAATILQDRFTL